FSFCLSLHDALPICLDFSCQTAEEAIRQAGNLLLENQYITRDYIDGMLNREKEHPTYLDYGVMIPHCTQDTLSCVLRPGISIVLDRKSTRLNSSHVS